jgi:predicted PurR-regulated permease PerM
MGGRIAFGAEKDDCMAETDTAERQPATVTPPGLPGLNTLVGIVTAVVVIAGLYLARDVLIPITLAVLLSFVLAPLVMLLRRLHIPHVLSVLVAVLLGLGALGLVGSVIGVQVAGLAADVPQYATTIERKIGAIRGATIGRIDRLTSMVERQVARTAAPPAAPASETGAPAAPGAKPMQVEVHQPALGPLELARSALEPILKPMESALIIFIVAIFILMQKEDLRDRLIRLFGSGDLHRTTTAMNDAGERLSRFFLSQLAINVAFGIVVALGLAFIGVPSPVLWGVLGTLLRFVPYIGALIAAALPIALAAAVSPDWTLVLWTAGLFVVTEVTTGQVVEPMVFGHSTGLSPVAVVVAAIFWSWIWGPIGLILSTPLTLCLVVLGRYVDRLEFLDVLLGDRPALTPVENFYQRMLADDPDEALQQAELLLKDRSLTSYYDEVALKGLQLAAGDAQRGVLDHDRMERLRGSVRELVDDLADHDDRDPSPGEKAEAKDAASKAEKDLPAPAAPAVTPVEANRLTPAWQGAAPVLCLAGRGPLDEAASSILAQLLGKHGLGARVAPHQAASRDGIARLNTEGVAMVCVSYLEIGGNPAALRYLVRRLKQRMPGVPVLVGLWPGQDSTSDPAARDAVAADYNTGSLREAVETCVTVAHKAAEANAPLAAVV